MVVGVVMGGCMWEVGEGGCWRVHLGGWRGCMWEVGKVVVGGCIWEVEEGVCEWWTAGRLWEGVCGGNGEGLCGRVGRVGRF